MAERKTLFERITTPFRREQTKQVTQQIPLAEPKTQKEQLTEAISLLEDLKIDEAKDLISSIDTTTTQAKFRSDLANTLNEEQLFNIYRQMDNDSIISSALDLFADNATQLNTKTKHVISIESEDRNFQDELNTFLWDTVNIDIEAWNYARSIAMYGKVVLDTKASNGGRDWAFIEVEKPENILPLTYGQDTIKYHAVLKDSKADQEKHSFYGSYKQPSLGGEQSATIEPQDRYLVGFNARKHLGKMVVETESPITKEKTTEELYVRGGKSFLEGIIETWRMLSTLEDSMFISRLVKSKAFNLVTIDVSDTNTKQSKEMVDSVKRSLRSAETIDQTADRYSNRQSPIPANDFVYVPIKGNKGTVTIEQVGGEVGAQDLSDIEYMRNKLFAGLGVLKAYLGFEETTPGGLGDTTLTMLDERFTRKVKRLRGSLAFVAKQIVEYYWLNSSVNRTLDNIPSYDILLGKISTQEETANRAELLDNIDVANEILNLTSAFPDKIDDDKLFDYLFNDIIGIDTTNFDNIPAAKDLIVKANQLTEVEIKALIENKIEQEANKKRLIENRARRRLPKRQKVKNRFNVIEGKAADLLRDMPLTSLLESYEIYLEDNKGSVISLHSALEQKDLRKSLNEATYKDLKQKTQRLDPERIKKSKKITGKYLGLDDNNFIVFRMSAEDPADNRKRGKPTSYETKVHLKALIDIIEARRSGQTDLNIVRDAVADDVAVACDCPASMYWGQQYNGTKEGYSIVKNTIEPTRNKQYQKICKHIAATLTLLPFWSNTIVRDLRAKGLLTATSKAKKDNVDVTKDVDKDKVLDKVSDKEAEQTPKEDKNTREQKIVDRAPKTKAKTKSTTKENVNEIDDEDEEQE